jgi:hypothetical protein
MGQVEAIPMRRAWGATGVGRYCPPRLTSASRKRIADELRSWNFILPDPEPFLDCHAAAIGQYDSSRHMRDTSRPAAVRANLNAALQAATKLNQRLNALDGNSCLLIKEAANVDKRSLRNKLDPIVQALFAASVLAKQYPNKGNLPENERLFLAADVRRALNTHLGANSSKALEGGCFEAILTVMLEEALRKQRNDVEALAHSLVDQVLSGSVKTEHPGGVVEYSRPQRREADT